MKRIPLSSLLAALPVTLLAQFGPRTPEQDSLMARMQHKTQADHRDMMAQLSIKELRPGPSGNPQAANAANVDEA